MTDQILNIEGIFIVVIFVIAMLIFLGMLIAVFITFRSTNRAGTESKPKDEPIAQPRNIKKCHLFSINCMFDPSRRKISVDPCTMNCL